MFEFRCFVLFLFVTWTQSLDFDTPCPDLPVMQNVDPERLFSGVWYNLRKYENKYQKSSDCGMTSFQWDGISINRTICEKRRYSYLCFNGVVTFLNPEARDGHLFYQDNKFKDMKVKATLLTSDYENYYIAYACVNKNDGTSKQMAWLYSRTTSLPESVKDEVTEIIAKHFLPAALFGVYQKEDFCAPRPNLN